MVNIFEDYLSDSPLKVNDIYKYQEVVTKTLAKFNAIIKDLKSLDPKKAELYARLALTPNPLKVLSNENTPFREEEFKKYSEFVSNVKDPSSGWDKYVTLMDKIASYKQSIPEIQEMPFQGRSTIESYSLDDSSLWDIKLTKYDLSSPKIPENPLKLLIKDGTGWFPATRVDLQYSTVKNQTFELPNNLKIMIPRYKSEVPSIEITCFDNEDSIIRRYFMEYMNAIYDDRRRTLPYKEASSELTLYIFTQDKKIKFKKIFYVIPEYDFSVEGAAASKVTDFRIKFNVIGESRNDDTVYKSTTPRK